MKQCYDDRTDGVRYAFGIDRACGDDSQSITIINQNGSVAYSVCDAIISYSVSPKGSLLLILGGRLSIWSILRVCLGAWLVHRRSGSSRSVTSNLES